MTILKGRVLHERTEPMTSDRALPLRPAYQSADDRPLTDELIVELRERVESRYYDRPDVLEAIARRIATRADAPG